jgi:pimeloyl-ACP methyl ester carboxylesterase
MGRRPKVGIAVVAAPLALLVLNALITDGQTKSAAITEPGGRILELPDGDLQVIDRNPEGGSPIVLIHCFSCAINWWDGMMPPLERNHRIVAVDLLGHGGSEKPGSGYTPENQAEVVAEALERLGIEEATVVGHSLGGAVTGALAQQHPRLVDRAVIIDMPPDNSYGGLGFIAGLAFQPLIGQALWRVKPDFSVRDGLGVAFAPGYDVPDAFVEDVKRMTYTSYDDSPGGVEDFLDTEPLDRRLAEAGRPLMVLMGAKEQIVNDPRRALAQYKAAVPDAQVHLIAGAGHSPNVERPALVAKLVDRFSEASR